MGGENRLNGEVVDYTKGFTGKPEVFTVRGTAGHDSSFVGCYWNTENGVPNGEIIGYYFADILENKYDQNQGYQFTDSDKIVFVREYYDVATKTMNYEEAAEKIINEA